MLKLRNLHKRFGETTAVEDLSLDIQRGEIFGLLGPNGAGKTTTVNMCIGLLAPDRGHVELEGLGSPTSPAVRRQIGVAPQSLAIYEDLTGEENLAFFGAIQGLRGAVLRERVGWALDFVGLADRRCDRAKTYSGGMKRRLNVAAALIHDPQLLILDEPTVGVDPQSRNAIFENILALQQLGRTIVYTTHYMEEAQRLCDRVGIVDRGRLLALDSVPALIDRYGGKSVLVVDDGNGEQRIATDDPVRELERIQGAGRLRSFRLEQTDLESVFLTLTGRTLRD